MDRQGALFIIGASGQLGWWGSIDESRNGQTLTLELNAVPYALHMEAGARRATVHPVQR